MSYLCHVALNINAQHNCMCVKRVNYTGGGCVKRVNYTGEGALKG